MADKRPIIIKRIKKGHAGAHGGSWKVAYADFVTAMMAFFLLMWLVSMSSPEKKAKVSQYFQEFSLFEKGGQALNPGETRGADIRVTVVPSTSNIPPTPEEDVDKGMVVAEPHPGQVGRGNATEKQDGQPLQGPQLRDKQGVKILDTRDGQSKEPLQLTEKSAQEVARAVAERNKERLKSELTKVIEERLADLKEQVLIDTFENGVRVQVVDKQGNPLFDRGKADLTAQAKRALDVIAESIKDLPNTVAVEGHTDAMTYASNRYTNWELSTARASSARREMETHGLDPDRLVRVAGYAATAPLIKTDPYDARNRRISILLFDVRTPSLGEVPPPQSAQPETPEPRGPGKLPGDFGPELH